MGLSKSILQNLKFMDDLVEDIRKKLDTLDIKLVNVF